MLRLKSALADQTSSLHQGLTLWRPSDVDHVVGRRLQSDYSDADSLSPAKALGYCAEYASHVVNGVTQDMMRYRLASGDDLGPRDLGCATDKN